MVMTRHAHRLLRDVVPLALAVLSASLPAAEEADYWRIVSVFTPEANAASRSKNWKPAPEGLALEVSGMTMLADGRLAVAIRKGEVWFIDGALEDPPDDVRYHRFATALHEPLGLIEWQDSLWTVQRSELTRLRDVDGDDVADEYLTVTKGWGVTGHYHEYAYGPKLDAEGNLWLTLNIGLGLRGEQLERTVQNPQLGYRQGAWRGWGMKVTASGDLQPVCAGMRSPCGLGANAAGDMFCTDQQGNWVATNSLCHLREGAFFHHPESLASMHLPGSTIEGIDAVPNGLSLPEVAARVPRWTPPAVWFPYKKVGQSPTDILLDASDGKFGPFAGQLFIGEFALSAIHRVFLEKVEGEYQGACFPFRSGFASAVLRLAQAPDGSVFAGLSNRGWSSLGASSYGLERLVWTGETPFEIREVRAMPDGFRCVFTLPVDERKATETASWHAESWTYLWHSTYGSDEIDRRALRVLSATVSEDRLSVDLRLEGLRELHVHALYAPGLRSHDGSPLLHPEAYYTLNRRSKR